MKCSIQGFLQQVSPNSKETVDLVSDIFCAVIFPKTMKKEF